jgi:hypothetical protein
MHITQPFPCSVQKLCEPTVPVASMNTSPEIVIAFSSVIARMEPLLRSMAVTRLISQISIP